MPITVTIPGGTAELFTLDEMTPRRKRASQVIALKMSPVLERVKNAGKIRLPDGTVKEGDGNGPSVDLSDGEASLFFLLTDASMFAHLKSWTLAGEGGAPLPLPASVDDVLDIPGPVYDALETAINAMTPVTAQFEPDEATLEDPNSPFGVSSPSSPAPAAP